MLTDLDQLQYRYDDLLLLDTKSEAEWEEIFAIERRIREILFPLPRRGDFTDQEWAAFWPAEEAARIAYDNAKYGSDQ